MHRAWRGPSPPGSSAAAETACRRTVPALPLAQLQARFSEAYEYFVRAPVAVAWLRASTRIQSASWADPCFPNQGLDLMLPLRLPVLLVLSLSTALAQAQGASVPPDLPLPDPPADKTAAAAAAWEGAVGLNLSQRPEYSGAGMRITKLSPVLFLRWGRFTVTNASGFVTRRADDVVRGLGVDLLGSERVRVKLALRFDRGRSEGSSAELAGLGDIKPTVRARVSAEWELSPHWKLGATWSADAFGRGGGNYGDVSVGYDLRLSPATTLGLGASLAVAGDRYLQTYYGVSSEQAARSNYPVYEPGAGLRDLSTSLSLRSELSHDWVLLGGAGMTRLLGPAANSPLTRKTSTWAANLGLAWRF